MGNQPWKLITGRIMIWHINVAGNVCDVGWILTCWLIPFETEIGVFRDNKVSTMDSDDLAPCVTWSSTAVVLPIQYSLDQVIHEQRFQIPRNKLDRILNQNTTPWIQEIELKMSMHEDIFTLLQWRHGCWVSGGVSSTTASPSVQCIRACSYPHPGHGHAVWRQLLRARQGHLPRKPGHWHRTAGTSL